MDFKVLTSLYFFVLLILFVSCNHQEEETSKPNILFIMSDDHTSQAWGVYGGILEDYVQNTNIKRLAAQGTLLENCFVTNSICTPSRGAIMTGQYSHKNGVYTLFDSLNTQTDSIVNVAQLLQDAGYQTGIIGKWHLKSKPSGFNYYNVLPGQGRYWNPVLKNEKNWSTGGAAYEGFSADVITDQTIGWLKDRNEDQPFFMMCHFKSCHEPFEYPERHNNLFEDIDLPEPSSLYDFGPETTGRSFIGRKMEYLSRRWTERSQSPETIDDYPGLPFSVEGLDSTETRKKTYQKFIKDYLRSAAAIDDNLGKLLDYLEQSGLAENTIVIYTSDQGYFLGEHGFIDKRMMYEESIRMPFVIRYPKEIPGGKRLDDFILNVDFPALFLDFAGVEPPELMAGRSFRENLKESTPEDWRTSMYYRYWTQEHVRPAHFGIRNDRYKLIFFYGLGLGMKGNDSISTPPAWEFFDLKEDPNELNNAYENEAYAEIIAQMKKELLTLREELGDTDEQFPEVRQRMDEYWEP